MKQFVKFAHFEKQNAIEMIFFDLPPLLHGGCHLFAVFEFVSDCLKWRQTQCGGVVIGVVPTSSLGMQVNNSNNNSNNDSNSNTMAQKSQQQQHPPGNDNQHHRQHGKNGGTLLSFKSSCNHGM